MSSLHFLKYSRTIWLIGLLFWILMFGIFSIMFIMPNVNGVIFWLNIGLYWFLCYFSYNLSRSEFVENPENNFKMKFADDTRYLLSEDKIPGAYYRLKGLKDENKLQTAYHQLVSKYLITKKTLDGYEHENPANQAVYYLLNKDHTFYYDEEKDALLAFTSKDSAQFYIKNEIPEFDGYILPLNVVVDGSETDKNVTNS